jgi:hypothetical protein
VWLVLLHTAPGAAAAARAPAAPGTVRSIAWAARADATIVTIEIEGLPPPRIRHGRDGRPDRILVELTGARLLNPPSRELVVDRVLADVAVVDDQAGTVRLILQLWRPVPYAVVETPSGVEIVVGRGGVAEASLQATAAPALAQVPPTGDRPAGPPPAGTAPEAPAGEPPAEPEASSAETPAGTAPPLPPTEWFVEERFSIVSQNVRGNRELSFLNQGVHYLQELDAEFRHRFEDGRQLEARFSGLLSDDFTLAPGQFALQSAHVKIQAPTYELTVGDVYQQVTTFTLALPIKGAGGFYELPVGAGLRIVGAGGVIKSRWDDFWVDGVGEQRTRYLGVLRVEQRLTPDVALGLTYLRARDDAGRAPGGLPPPPLAIDPADPRSLFDVPPPVTAQFGTPPVSNQVWSTDLTVRALDGAIAFEAEAARSWADLDLDTPGGRAADEAYLAQLLVNRAGLRASGRYLRVDPDFFSGGSFAFPDQEEWTVQADYDLPRWITVGGGYTDARDNLGHTKVTTIRSRMPEARLLLRELPRLADLLVEGRYRLRETDASDGSVAETARTWGVNAQYQAGIVRLTGGYEHQKRTDSLDHLRNERVNLVTVGAEARIPVGTWTVGPAVRYEWFSSKRIREGSQDTTNRYEALITVDWPDIAALTAGGYYSDNNTFFATEDLSRWAAGVELRVRLFGREDRTITLSYEYRDNDYADSIRDYAEEIAAARLVLRY